MSGSNVKFQSKDSSTQVYTSGSGNFVVPEGVHEIFVEMYGGGGSGATTRSVEISAGIIYSGEAGNVVTTRIAVTPAQSLAYSIGAGGVAPAAGGVSAIGTIGATTTLDNLNAAGGAGAGYDRFTNLSAPFGVGVGRDGLRGSGGSIFSTTVTTYGGDGGYGNGGTGTSPGASDISGGNGGVGAGGSSGWGSVGNTRVGGNGGAGRIQIWWVA